MAGEDKVEGGAEELVEVEVWGVEVGVLAAVRKELARD